MFFARPRAVFARSALATAVLWASALGQGAAQPDSLGPTGASPQFLPSDQAGQASPKPERAQALKEGPEIPVTPMNLEPRSRAAYNSPLLVADPTEPRFVVLANRQDAQQFGCGLQVSGSGGRGWVSADPVPKLPKGADECYAPEVAFDRNGLLYYLFIGLHGSGHSPMGVFLTTSKDRGRTFAPPHRVLGPYRYQVRMALDPSVGKRGRIHLVWLDVGRPSPSGGLPPPPNPIVAAFSDDGGGTFSKPIQISSPNRRLAVGPALAVGADHSVNVAYYDLQDDVRDYQGLEGPAWDQKWSLVLARSNDKGRHFRDLGPVDEDVVPPERVLLIYTMPPPSLLAAPGGKLYVAWYDARNGDWDFFVRRSADAGRTWALPVRANDDQLHNGRHQYLPRLSLSRNGRLDAIFYDRRGNVENRGNDVYYTFSMDEGAHFEPNIKLTSLDSDSHIGPRYAVESAKGLTEFGGRIALLSEPSRVLAAWTDTRNEGRGQPAQDIFVTDIKFPQPPKTGPTKGPNSP